MLQALACVYRIHTGKFRSREQWSASGDIAVFIIDLPYVANWSMMKRNIQNQSPPQALRIIFASEKPPLAMDEREERATGHEREARGIMRPFYWK